ncbi:uncharacterized protein BDR25DRAFT_232582 [Lindgomyces ingoldianus]|uniref:Uncharacterized protein n=1 Tax=Lindgomyces ingoldianus TaxID=673940 RepID=A0ACB6QM71_9PLEO|nr:uncharacterized protein BDR25DRAFT_232582 [Lindgomyces ingoldianus]KAF2468073.1 hypothetical protein BDR25DRAFT_232582 [Lindgomyces ingoldianus]
MAAPSEKTIRSLDGKWIINKTLSDSTDPVLALQGMGWLTRKAIGLATVTQHLKSYTEPPEDNPTGAPITHIEIQQTASGGLKGTSEKRILDWQFRPHSDYLFGDLRGRSRWNTLTKLKEEYAGKALEQDAEFLCEGWLEETVNGEVVDSFVENEGKGWTAWQIWGFAEVDGVRMLTRRFVVRRGEEAKSCRLIYDWAGPLA